MRICQAQIITLGVWRRTKAIVRVGIKLELGAPVDCYGTHNGFVFISRPHLACCVQFSSSWSQFNQGKQILGKMKM